MRIARRAHQQHEGTSCRPRPQESSEHAASGDYGPQQFRLEIFRRQVGDRHWSPAQQPEHVFLAQLANRAPGLQHAPEITSARVVNIRRRGCERVGNDFADLGQRLLKLGILARILLRKGGDFLRGFASVLIQRERPSVRTQRRHAHFGSDHPQAMLFQLHVADDVGTDRSCGVSQGRASKARMELVRNSSPADLRAALEYERLESSLGQIKSGDQPVVTAADDDDIPLGIGRHVTPPP